MQNNKTINLFNQLLWDCLFYIYLYLIIIKRQNFYLFLVWSFFISWLLITEGWDTRQTQRKESSSKSDLNQSLSNQRKIHKRDKISSSFLVALRTFSLGGQGRDGNCSEWGGGSRGSTEADNVVGAQRREWGEHHHGGGGGGTLESLAQISSSFLVAVRTFPQGGRGRDDTARDGNCGGWGGRGGH